MIEGDINERMLRFAPSQGVPFEPDPIALEVLAETEADAPPAVAAGFDPVAMQIARESQEEMMATLRGASAVNPDQAARAQRIGQQVGIGQDVVLRNMAEMEREAVARQVMDRDLMRTAPNLARFLGQREFATIAHDDIDGLTKAERTFRWFAGIPKDVEEGLSRAVATSELGKMYERQMQGIEPTWLDKVVIKSYNDELRRVSEESGFIESAANIVGIQAELATQVPEYVGMGALMGGGWGALGGPLAPATVPAGLLAGGTVGLGVGFARAAYVLEAGNAYGSMVEEGIDREDARRIATGVGVVNAGLELVGLKLIAAPFRTAFQGAVRRAVSEAVAQQTTRAALATAGRQYGLAVLGETGTEVLQEISTVAGEELGRYGSDLPMKLSTEEGRAEVAKRLVDTAVDTAKGMSLVGLPGPVVNFYVNTRKVAEARKAERFFTDLADASKEVKVAERSPLAYESFLAAQVEGTAAETIFVDARTMQSVLQQAQRDDPALTDAVIDEAMPGIREQIAQQLETGGDVTIPTAQFGARLARTTLGRQMIPHMRLNPDALSVTEAVKHREQMDALRAEAVRLMQEQDAAGASFSQEAEAVRDGMRSRLEAAGRDREAADVESMLYRDFVVTQAARRGMTPSQFHAAQGLRGVEGEMAPAAAPLEQPAQFTPSGERRTDTPEFKAWSQNAPMYEADSPGFTTGTPMVVRAYHGTDKTFVKFKMDRPAWFAARPGTAGEYVAGGRRKMGDKPKRGSQIIPVYLAFQNPLDLRYNVGGQTTVTPQSRMSMVDVLSAAGLPNDEAALRAIAERNLAAKMAGVADTIADKAGYLANTYSEPLKLWSLLDDYGLIETLKDAGFDGLILNEGGNIFAAFNDNDIKSVNNRGTWSRTTANIMQQAARMDAEYMAAVQRGDMETAQRMVDEAATQLGFTIEAFHGTPEGGFTEFRDSPRGLFFTNKETLAAGYTYFRTPWLSPGKTPTIYRTRLRMQNPLRIDAGGARNNNIPFPGREYKRTVFGNLPAGAVSVEEAARLAFEQGHDGIIIENVMDGVTMDDKTKSTVYVIPTKEQVKSADPVTYDEAGNVIPLSRRFDITSPRIFEQAPVAPGFYSALEREVAAIDAKALTASGWGERMKGLISKGAIKADELEWSGLSDYLKMQEGKVSKDAVLEFLRGNGVRVERTTLMQRATNADPADIRALEQAGLELSQDPYNLVDTTFFSRTSESFVDAAEVQGLADQGKVSQEVADAAGRVAAAIKAGGLPKYDRPNLVLPGGTNYREVLLTLPARPSPQQPGRIEKLPNGKFLVYYPRLPDALFDTRDQAERDLVQKQSAVGEREDVFRTTHWDQPNVLVHLRMNDRVDADGKRVLFVEEVQSDWGQAGRKKGFAEPKPADFADRVARLKTELDVASERVSAARIALSAESGTLLSEMGLEGYEDILLAGERKQELKAQYAALQEASPAYIAARQEVVEAERVEAAISDELNDLRFPGERIARAPFVETTDGWLNLGLKQVLLEAVRGNYDRVAFVNGEQSAGRYDLAKQVRLVSVNKQANGKYLTYIEGIDGTALIRNRDGFSDSGQKEMTAEELEATVGKEVAKQAIEGKPNKDGWVDVRGDNLRVGGEGMKSFYDKIVPAAINKLLKKYGGEKVGEVLLPNMNQAEMEADAERMGMTVADVLDVAEPSEYQQNQPGFAVTPEMVKKLESGLPLFQAAAAPTPGPRGGFDPKRLTILLNKQADLSTFLHELSHYFLATYTDLAARGVASPEQLADLDTTLQWFGIAGDTPAARLAAWNALPLDGQRQFHEQFAYNFEVYAFEGKSPSVELRGVFERFSAYLKRVYKSIRDELNAIYRREFGKDLPILTGEVRSVFDRMLASDEAIRRQQAIDGVKPAFLTREQAGVDEATWAEHQAALADAEAIAVGDMTKASMRAVQWMSNGRSRIVKEMQARHDAKRKEVREEVAAQVRMEPAYRAQAYLRYGRFIDADGQEVEIEGPHKLDLDTVKQMYELEPEAIRPDVAAMARGKYGFVGKDGLNPDVVAETFGYSSGDQMIRAVTGLKPIKEAIDERTDAVMQERFGDMNTKEAVDAEVQKAMHNEARARFVAIELKFASKATAPARVIVEAARQAARDIIAAKKVRDVRPSEHVAAEARAAREAVTAGQFPDPSATAQAASTRAYNEAIAAGKDEATAGDEAMQAGLRAAEAARARIAEFESRYPGATREQVIIRAKRQEMYQNQLAAEALRVRDEVEKDVKYLRRVLRDENVKRMGADATDQVAELLSRFDVAGVPLKILDRRKATLAAWMEAKADGGIVPDIAPELLEAGRRVNYRDMTVAEFRDLVSAVKQIEYVGKNERKLQLAEEKAEFEEKRDEIVTRIRAVGKLRGLDLDPRTPLTNIGRTVSKLRNFAASHLKAASIARVLDGGKDDGPLWNTVIRTANAAADMETRMRAEATARLAEILKPVFALGNMGGKGMFFQTINRSLNREARIAIAMNMGNAGNVQRLLDGEGWTMAQLQPVLESLTADEWNAVQATWDFLETYRPLVGAKERRLYGKEPNWVEPQPLTVRTADGQTLTLRGGYYPVKYDPVASDRVATFDEVQEAKDALRGTYTAATTRRSFTKARAEKVTDRPILYTLDAAFSGVNDVIHDLAWHEWLISTNRLLRDQEFANAVRETRGPEFLKQLREWAKDNAAGDRSSNVEGVLSWLRQGISASGLGFNVMSAALQITGFNQSVVRVGAKYVGLGIAEFTASPFATSAMVRDKSSFMAERQRTQFRELNELRNTVRGKNAGVRKALAQAYVAMMTMQRAVDTPTWVGAYRKALDGGKDDATAVALADQAVKDSQGSGLTSDLAAIERGGPGLRLFTVFYSYMNTVYNMAAVQTMTARGKGKLAADYVLLMVVPVVLGHAIKSLLTPDAGDDDFDPEALARKLAAEELSFLMGTMVVAREFGGAAQLLTGAEGARMGYGGPAGVRAIGEAYNLATQTGQMEFDRAWFRSAINTLGAFTGLPSAQINRTIDGIEAIMEGEVEGVGAVVAPLTGVRR